MPTARKTTTARKTAAAKTVSKTAAKKAAASPSKTASSSRTAKAKASPPPRQTRLTAEAEKLLAGLDEAEQLLEEFEADEDIEVPEGLEFESEIGSVGTRDDLNLREPFRLDGEVLWAVKPKDALLALIRQAKGDEQKSLDLMHTFLENGVDKPTRDRLWERMLDPDDALDMVDVANLMRKLVEFWSTKQTNRAGRRAAYKAAKRTTGRG